MRVIDMVAELFAKGFEGTADEAAFRLNEHPLTVRPRVSELLKAGRLRPTGTKKGQFGRTAQTFAAMH